MPETDNFIVLAFLFGFSLSCLPISFPLFWVGKSLHFFDAKLITIGEANKII